jgi:broad specificity phosphatase PhoE
MPRLYLIRHGKPSATWGENADADPGLDEAGRAQATAAARALLALPVSERPVRVFSSPLRRCRETAAPTAAAIGVPLEIDERFGEIPTPRALSQEERGPWLRNAFLGEWTAIIGDVDYDVWKAGVGEALGGLDVNTAVFSHFVAINAALACVSGETRVLTFRPDHASISVLESLGGRLRLIERGPEASTQVL